VPDQPQPTVPPNNVQQTAGGAIRQGNQPTPSMRDVLVQTDDYLLAKAKEFGVNDAQPPQSHRARALLAAKVNAAANKTGAEQGAQFRQELASLVKDYGLNLGLKDQGVALNADVAKGLGAEAKAKMGELYAEWSKPDAQSPVAEHTPQATPQGEPSAQQIQAEQELNQALTDLGKLKFNPGEFVKKLDTAKTEGVVTVEEINTAIADPDAHKLGPEERKALPLLAKLMVDPMPVATLSDVLGNLQQTSAQMANTQDTPPVELAAAQEPQPAGAPDEEEALKQAEMLNAATVELGTLQFDPSEFVGKLVGRERGITLDDVNAAIEDPQGFTPDEIKALRPLATMVAASNETVDEEELIAWLAKQQEYFQDPQKNEVPVEGASPE
jgi:hypothetical protein